MNSSASTIAFLILTSPVWIFVVGLPLAGSLIVGKKLLAILRRFEIIGRDKISNEDRIWLIRNELKEHDTKMHGFNPAKYNYSIHELFPKEPSHHVVNELRKKIFSLSDLQSVPIERTEKIKYWYSVFLAMALMRADMKKQKMWNAEKEGLWIDFPFRPRAMREVDPAYFESVRDKYLGNHLETREPCNKLAC